MGLLVVDCMEADLNASLRSSVRKVLDLSGLNYWNKPKIKSDITEEKLVSPVVMFN